MSNHYIYISIFALFSCLFLSCTDQDDRHSTGAVPVTFVPQMAGEASTSTRAVDNKWTDGDKVGIGMRSSATQSVGEVEFKAYTTTTGTTTTLSPPVSGGLFYPTNGDKVHFVAYSPYQAPADGKVTYRFDDQIDSTEDADFIWCTTGTDLAKGYNYNSSNVPLNFGHMGSKIKITVTDGGIAGGISLLALSIQEVPTTATYSLTDGSVVSTTDEGTITPKKESNDVYTAILPPHSGTATIEFVGLLATGYNYKIAETFKPGKSYEYKFELSDNGVELVDAQTVDWTGGEMVWNGSNYLKVSKTEIEIDEQAYTDFEVKGLIETNCPGIDCSKEPEEDWINEVTIDGSTNIIQIDVNALPADIESRVGKITLTGTDTDGEAVIPGMKIEISVIQRRKPTGFEPIPGANCYILTPGGSSVLIPISRAKYYYDLVDKATEFAPHDVVLLWSDVAAGDKVYGTNDAPIANVEIIDGDLIKVTSGTTNPVLEGNAVIALRNSDKEILWSWHIWLTDYNPNASLKYNHVHPNKPVFMDRNLGALSATPGDVNAFGLYYQWGRKDPFPRVTSFTNNSGALSDIKGTFYDASGVKQETVTANTNITDYHTSFSNPEVFAINWGAIEIPGWSNEGSKALDDPCPQGWRVPISSKSNDVNNPWNGLDNTAFPWKVNELGCSNNAIGYWPASGYRDAGSGMFNFMGTGGCYWSSAVSSATVYYLYFYGTYVNPMHSSYRDNGFVVRCVPD